MPCLSTPRVQFARLLISLSFVMAPAAVRAQTEPQLQGPLDGPDVSQAIADEDQFVFGVGGHYAPSYHGAKEYRFQLLPMIDVKQGRFFANLHDGIGINLFDSENMTVGMGLTVAEGYRGKDAPPGIGKLSTGLAGRGFVKLWQAGFEATFAVEKIVAGNTGGVVAEASLAFPLMVSDRLILMPSIGTTWADRNHVNRYFGVTPQQSAASHLSRYRAGSGFVDAKAEVAAVYRLGNRVEMMALGGISCLLGDAKDSPIVYHETRPYALLAITYSL